MGLKKLLVLIFVTAVTIIVVGLGSFYTLFSYLQTETIVLPNRINASDTYPLISLNKYHKISINGDQKAIWNFYQVQANDFVEGVNSVIIQRFSAFGLQGNIREYIINVDRVTPNLSLTVRAPQEVVSQESVPVYITKDGDTELFLDDKPVLLQDGKIDVSLKPGQNTSRIKVADSFGNTSKVLEIQINNLVGEQYKTVKCGQFSYVLDTSRVQIGYSGVEKRPEITNQTDEYFARANTPQCDKDNTYIPVYPLGTKADCWNCGFGSTYIMLTDQPKSYNRPPVENQLQYPYVVSAGEYLTKSGIKGDLVKKSDSSNGVKFTNWSFEFVINDTVYNVSAAAEANQPSFATTEADFQFFIDHLYLTDPKYNQTNIHSTLSAPSSFDDKSGGLRFTFQPDWKIDVQKIQVEGTSVKTIIAQKSTYSISISESEKDKGGSCGGIFDPSEQQNYIEKQIDGHILLVPLVTVLKSQDGIGGNTNVLKMGQNQYSNSIGYCLFTIGGHDIRIDVNTSNRGEPVTSFDKAMEKEVIDLISSIKWS